MDVVLLGHAAVAASQQNEEELVLRNFDSRHIVLMYSADDKICRPLQKLYDRMMHVYKESWLAEGMSDDEFEKYGFITPQHLNDHPYEPAGIWPTFDAYYRLPLGANEEPRIVRVQDTQFRGTHNALTNVYVLKPHIDITGEKLKDDEIAFGVIFGHSENAGFPQINLPYFFEKNHVDKNYSFVSKKYSMTATDKYHFLGADIGIGLVSGVTQRVFEFHGKAIFIARGVPILAYEIKNGNKFDAVCYLASSVIRHPHVDAHRGTP